jgi:hypothetical protein
MLAGGRPTKAGAPFSMVFHMTKPKKSTVSALFALGFFGGLFFLYLSAPDFYYGVVYGGILISSALTVYFWLKERKADPKTSPVGMWIILAIVLLFVFLCIILPGL